MRFLIALNILILVPQLLNAQDSRPGFPMLENAPTPSGLAINEASVSIPHGSGSIFINPALLVFSNSSTLDFGYSSWMEESNFIFGGANFINGKRVFSIGIYNSKIDGIEQRNNPGEPNGEFSVSYLSLSGAFAYDFEFLSLGVAAQYLNEENFQYQASGYAFNFGASSQFFDTKLKTGISILNIGKLDNLNSQATKLPELLRAGFSLDIIEFAPPKNNDLPVLVSISSDLVNPLNKYESSQIGETDNDPYFNLGLRLNVAEVIELSGGYKTGDTAKPISFGVGVRTEQFNVDYALVPYETGFGTLHSIGLQYKF